MTNNKFMQDLKDNYTSAGLIRTGRIILVGEDYLTDDGREIHRTYIGRRGSTLAWKVNGTIYKNLVDAYYE